ncbi:MAG: TldD/PmbA family protein [Candidatus Thorarchaeota archaeon]
MDDEALIAIESALDAGASFADVRIENSNGLSIEVTDGVTRSATLSYMKGAGVRALAGGIWVFIQTTDLTPEKMRETGRSAGELARSMSSRVSERFTIEAPTFRDSVRVPVKTPLRDVSIEEKMLLVKDLDEQGRRVDERIKNTVTTYREVWEELRVVNSLGSDVSFQNSLPLISSTCTSIDGDKKRQSFLSVGGRGGFELMRTDDALSVGERAAKIAIDLLSSTVVRGGTYDVVMDPELNGTMVHEAFGHACEADFWLSHSTVLEGRLGESVGPDFLNISDDPTLPNMRGTCEYDWEGTRTRKHRLVEKGMLTDLLHSLETASRLGCTPNGAARAASSMGLPIPRMSNTFMEPGDWDVNELIEDTRQGLLLCGSNYGYTEPSKGQFMFQASHGYLIEHGELGQMVSDVSLAGSILDVLNRIDAVADDFKMQPGLCGKNGQMVPEMSGGPHARIRGIPVGGV